MAMSEEPVHRRPPQSSGKAVAALVCGLVSLCLPCLPAIAGVVLGILGIRDINRSRGRLSGQGLAIAGIVVSALSAVYWVILLPVGIGLLVPAVQKVREAAVRTQSQNNLRRIGLALHNYHDTYNTFPPPAITDSHGEPLLSWRVTLLPYLGEEALYKEFHLNEPWDSPHNRALLNRMPELYRSPLQHKGVTVTHYQVFVGRKTDEVHPMFVAGRGVRLPEIQDGMSNTFMVVEAANPVEWTRPEDLPYTPGGPLPQLGVVPSAGFNALFADGSVRFLHNGMSEQVLRDLITCNDGNMIPPDAIR